MTDEMQAPTRAVMIMAYGGPSSLDEVGPFMLELTGREPSQEVLDRVKMRYLTIGGASPLPEMSMAIAMELEKKLESKGYRIPVALGFRYCAPRIQETLAGMYAAGVREVVTVSLSPFESKITTEAYRAEVEAACADLPELSVVEAPLLSTLPMFAELHALGMAVANEQLEQTSLLRSMYVMTAHSLPLSDLVEHDPYVEGLRTVAGRIAGSVMLAPGAEFSDNPELPGISAYGNMGGQRPWLIAYQSKGERPGEWLKPELDEVIEVAAAAGYTSIIGVPIGFAIDHMETLYDLDVVAAGRALELEMDWTRSDVPNADDRLVNAIADSVVPLIGMAAGSGDQSAVDPN